MHTAIKNLLPRDTRTIEFNSSFGLMIISSFLLMEYLTGIDLDGVQNGSRNFVLGLSLFLFCVGLPQFILNYCYEHIFAGRAFCAWAAGSFWVWLAVSTPINLETIPTFLLGASNLVAFTLNIISIKATWKFSPSKL